MRILVACPYCRRQYDATGEAPGTRFHCQCGSEVVVQAPVGHEADVVRCSSCGAPRESGAQRCNYCRSDFTIHETDLETVCPVCLALVSDRAHFCHHCGTPIVPTAPLGEQSTQACPVCGPERRLRSRKLGQMPASVLECQVCAGLWVDLAVFAHVLNAEAQGENLQPLAGPLAQEPEHNRRYRPCAVCGQLMGRRNFGGTSRVIVDICGLHGIWFDAGELAQLLAWMRSGGLGSAVAEFGLLKGAPGSARRASKLSLSTPHQRAAGVLPEDSTAQAGRLSRDITRLLHHFFG